MLRLCEQYKERGVVGIDLAGDEGCANESEFYFTVRHLHSKRKIYNYFFQLSSLCLESFEVEAHSDWCSGYFFSGDLFMKSMEEVSVFQAAKEKGIHRTIHAGEAGPASCVKMVSSLTIKASLLFLFLFLVILLVGAQIEALIIYIT